MRLITDKIESDVEISEDTSVRGLIIGEVRVTDCVLDLQGMVIGNIIVNEHGSVNIYGTVNGVVINRGGELRVWGMIYGSIQELAGLTWIDSKAVIRAG
jgi:hypothetical protein